MLDALAWLGRPFLDFLIRLGRGSVFLLNTLAGLPGLLLRPRLLVKELHSVGVRSLLIILVSGLFVGMVMALQSYYALVDLVQRILSA